MKISLDITVIRPSTYAAIFAYISFIIVIISFSTPYWLASDGTQADARFRNLGLWEACFNRFTDTNFRFDLEYRGCKWIFNENYQFLSEFLRPRKFLPFSLLTIHYF